ncbi:hypothetical protein ACFQER_08510 [Halomicroarcula sp. GCM10025894]|uniref:hypothetical protein n=1 Tax=Halomicroarcula sp. GCM10025894 TaxID=3252673 RepID=UPI003622A22B
MFQERAKVDSFLYSAAVDGDPSFHKVGGASGTYTAFTGSDEDFSSGDRMEAIIDSDNSDVEVVKIRMAIIEGTSNDVLYQETVIDNT